MIWTFRVKFGKGSIIDRIYEVMIVTVTAFITVENIIGVPSIPNQ